MQPIPTIGEPTAMSIQLEIEQRNWKPQPEKPPKFKRGKTALSYNQDVCSTVEEVYIFNQLNQQ